MTSMSSVSSTQRRRRGEARARIERTFGVFDPTGEMAAECWRLYQRKLAAWTGGVASRAAFVADWPANRQALCRGSVVARGDRVRPPGGGCAGDLLRPWRQRGHGTLGRLRGAPAARSLRGPGPARPDRALDGRRRRPGPRPGRRGRRRPVTAPRASRRFAAYVFDLDGTVYLDDHLHRRCGRRAALGARDRCPCRVPDQQPPAARGCLRRQADRAWASRVRPRRSSRRSMRSTGYLDEAPPAGPILLIAEPLVGEVLLEAGHRLTDQPDEAAMVVVSWDRGFDYGEAAGRVPGGAQRRPHRGHQPGPLLPHGRWWVARLRRDARGARGVHGCPRRGGRGQAIGAHGEGHPAPASGSPPRMR